MAEKNWPLKGFFKKHDFGLGVVILAVAVNGLVLVVGTLHAELLERTKHTLHSAFFSVPLLSGITLIYLSSLLSRLKRTAWVVSVPIYCFILGLAVVQFFIAEPEHHLFWPSVVRSIILPIMVITGLIAYRHKFVVKSDIESFRQSLGFIVIVLAVTFCYGVAGYMLMDKAGFHKELGFVEAAHRTIDQFGLTVQPLTAYTRKARIFSDSLSVVSTASAVYIALSLFQPIRARFGHQAAARERMRRLLEDSPASSEDFFKLWPQDKNYFFDDSDRSGLAFHVHRGIALVVGDPAGAPANFKALIEQFERFCYGNDWRPSFIHTEPKLNDLYKDSGYSLQKIGEEAILEIGHFKNNVVRNKYFRHIKNKFEKAGYVAEILQPPHNLEVLTRLSQISKEWLQAPGRTERGFMMGYFSAQYMDMCPVFVLRDEHGKIQAFLNQVPSFDAKEANFDLFRQASGSPGNIIDFLFVNFIDYLEGQGFERLNMGLCPLAGLDTKTKDDTMLDKTLRFVYASGNRFYSFSGLKRFKDKYEPQWQDRYVVYRGGLRGVIRTANSLDKAMKVKRLKR